MKINPYIVQDILCAFLVALCIFLSVQHYSTLSSKISAIQQAEALIKTAPELAINLGNIIFQQPFVDQLTGNIKGTALMTDTAKSYGLNTYFSTPLLNTTLFRITIKNNEFLCVAANSHAKCFGEIPLTGLE